MKTFYYVVEKQLESVGDVQETNGWKNIRIYRIENGEMILVSEFQIEEFEDSEESVDEELFDNSYVAIGEQIKLIQL